MLAAFYERMGAARDVLRLDDIPDPQPLAGEVRVRIRWSGLNPSDVKSRAGLLGRPMAFERVIPQSDGMGVVDAVGDGVDKHIIGRRVWIYNAAWGRPFGTAAGWTCVPEQMAVPLPDCVPDEAGACMGIPAMTALHALLMDGGVAGKTVLIAGGAGAVGHYAIQFAARLGAARILTTVSSASKAKLAREAGADEAINYKTTPLVEQVRELTRGLGVDRVIEVDMAVNGIQNLDLLRVGGECVAYGSSPAPLNLPFPALLAKNVQLKFFLVYQLAARDRAVAQAALQGMLRRQDLVHNIGVRLPLSEIAAAHEMVEQGQAVGNVVLSVP
jgi:NADPH2:quinone reductase